MIVSARVASATAFGLLAMLADPPANGQPQPAAPQTKVVLLGTGTPAAPDLIFTPWTLGRRVPPEVYGPKGLRAISIVISGDTNPTQATIDACRGCDVLIHEAHSPAWLATRPDTFQRFSAKYHTTTAELADLAREARPRLLILYHCASRSPEELFSEMLARYPGHFVVGRDLDIY